MAVTVPERLRDLHDAVPVDWAQIDQWFNVLTVAWVVVVLASIAAVLRRETRLGRRLSEHDMAFALVYLASLLSAWVSVFGSEPWRYIARVLILFVATRVLLEMKRTFGGWWALVGEVWYGLRHWFRVKREPMDKEGY